MPDTAAMPACELVIFDCDGTLMDSELIIVEEEAAAYREAGIEISAKEFQRRFTGQPEELIRETLEAEFDRHLPDDFDKDVPNRTNERLWREVKAIEGAHAMLDNLDQPRCICSNSSNERLKIELTRGELWDRFRPYIYSSQDIEGVERKPEPDVFLYAAKAFETKPEACVVVEDSVPGVTAGVAAGMRVVGFTGGSHSWPGHADALTDAGAETVIAKITDLPQLIEALSMWEGMNA